MAKTKLITEITEQFIEQFQKRYGLEPKKINRFHVEFPEELNKISAFSVCSVTRPIWEKAERINEKEFENITGLNFENFCYYLTYIRRKIDPRKYLNIGNKIDESIKIQMINDEFVEQLVSFIKSGDIDIKDLYKISSYGLVERNGIKKIVLIDYGITNDIYFKYYKIYEKRLLR